MSKVRQVIEEMTKVRQSVHQNVELIDKAIWRLGLDDESK